MSRADFKSQTVADIKFWVMLITIAASAAAVFIQVGEFKAQLRSLETVPSRLVVVETKMDNVEKYIGHRFMP